MIHAREKLQFTKQHALTTGLTCGFLKLPCKKENFAGFSSFFYMKFCSSHSNLSNPLVKSL